MPPSQTTFQTQEKQRVLNTFLKDIEKSIQSTTATEQKPNKKARLNRELLEKKIKEERAILANNMAKIARELLRDRVTALAERRGEVEKELSPGEI